MNRLIFTKVNQQAYSFYYEDNALVELDVDNEHSVSLLGQIYVGQVKNVLPNIQAAFVEYEKGRNGFLPLNDVDWRDKPLRAGEELIVQIAKDAVKTKDPVLTTKLTLTGVYTVVQMYDSRIGYSSKLTREQRKTLKGALESRLRSLQEKIYQNSDLHVGIIVRTNASDCQATPELIMEEADRLADTLTDLIQKGKSRKMFSRLTSQTSFYHQKYLHFRQLGIDEIITEEVSTYELLKQLLTNDHLDASMVRLYTDKTFPLSALYSLTTRLEEALSTKVWLKSGGFLVIEETEALTVIDVNSGKNIAGKEKEKTFQTVNLEAALECARQIRLRNFNGIIIIDFINCKDNAPFIHALKAAIAKDPIKTSYIDITPLGLVEVTRQKKTPPLSEKIQKTHQS